MRVVPEGLRPPLATTMGYNISGWTLAPDMSLADDFMAYCEAEVRDGRLVKVNVYRAQRDVAQRWGSVTQAEAVALIRDAFPKRREV